MSTPATEEVLREAVRAALLAVVPDAPLDTLDDTADLRNELELDSIDFLAFVERLNGLTGVRIDEDDYRELRTMKGCLNFLSAHP